MGYRSKESYHARTPEGLDRQRAGLKKGRLPGIKTLAPATLSRTPDTAIWLDPVASAESLLGGFPLVEAAHAPGGD